MKIKSQILALLFSSLVLPALSFGQTVVTYTATGVLQVVTGADKLGLAGSTVTVTNTLTEGQTPVAGTTNQYTTSATIADPNFPLGITLKNVAATVTLNYLGAGNTGNNIGLNANASILGLALTVVSTTYVPSIAGLTPGPISLTNLTTADTIIVSDSTGSTTYDFASGTISSVPANACPYVVAPLTLDFPISGGQQTVTVSTGAACPWTAVSNNPWITLSPTSGTGSGTVTVTVGANTQGVQQIGSAIIAEQAVNITQDGPLVCSFSVSPLSLAFPAAGGAAQVLTISASAPTCQWTAVSPVSWLSLNVTSGTGSGTILASALPNTNSQNLTGTIVVAGQSIPVSEAGTSACSFTVAPTSLLFIASGGSVSLTLSASGPNCAWTASFVNAPTWASVSPASGVGGATVTVTVTGNGTGGIKNATLDIAGQVVQLQQSNTNACSFTVTSVPNPMTFVSSPSVGFVTIVASGPACQWSVSSAPDWLVPNTYKGSGSTTLSIQATANTATTVRTGVLTIAGVTLNVSQNGTLNPCNFTVSLTSLLFTNNGGSLPLTLGVSASTCPWTATSSDTWVTVTPATGTGIPTLPLTVVAQGNTTGASRTATLTIGGLAVAVTQSATSCTYTVAPTSIAFPSQGGPVPVTVTTSDSTCAWTATSSVPWLTFAPAGSTGTGTINAIAATNITSATESVSVTIAGQVIPVTVASVTGCTFTVSNPSVFFPNTGGSAVASVVASGISCAWTASAPPWITLSATAGMGSSSILMTAAGDQTGPTQSGAVVLAGTTIPVSQSGGCSFTVSPTSIAVDIRGILQPVMITTSAPSCVWTATAPAFGTLTANMGTGSGNTTLSIPYNPTGTDITGTLTVAGQNISVVQDFTQQVFQDVPPGTFYFDAVNLLAQKGITAGCGPATFCPNTNITRAQMAVFVVTAAYNGGPFTTSQVPYFKDVPVGSFGFDWIQKFYELGLTDGCSVGNFCPDSIVTRDQSAIFLIKARYGATTVFDYPPTPTFNDVPASYFAFSWIQRMAEDQITAGCGNNDFCPTETLNRGQMAIFIMRAIYNAFAPVGTPEILSVVPNTLPAGATTPVTITGVDTLFSQGLTLVSAIPGVTISNVVVSSATTLTATMTVNAGAPAQPNAVYVITGAQEAVLPFGITVQAP